MTLYFHSWQYLVREWLYRDIIFPLLIILVRGWLYRDIIFSLLAIVGEGVIISWHHIFIPDNIGEGVIISWHYIFTLGNIWWGVIISWHIFTPDNIGEGVIISWHYIIIPDTTLEWRWLHLNIFTIQIWLSCDTRVLLFISIYSPHETWGVEVIIFKHNNLFAVET